MDWLIWGGAILSLAGIVGLIWCIVQALGARRSGQPDDVVRARLQRVVVMNMAALGISALGLMLVVAGILLG